MNVMKVIKKRRSIRRYKPKSIPEKHIKTLIEAAQLAPSMGNLQPWMFGIITEKSLKEELAKTTRNPQWVAEAPVIIVCCCQLYPWDEKQNDMLNYHFGERVAKQIQTIDHTILEKVFHSYSLIIAVEHIVLAASSLKLGSCWIGYFDSEKAGKILGLPENLYAAFLLPIGYPAEQPKPVPRKPIETIMFYNKYDK